MGVADRRFPIDGSLQSRYITDRMSVDRGCFSIQRCLKPRDISDDMPVDCIGLRGHFIFHHTESVGDRIRIGRINHPDVILNGLDGIIHIRMLFRMWNFVHAICSSGIREVVLIVGIVGWHCYSPAPIDPASALPSRHSGVLLPPEGEAGTKS